MSVARRVQLQKSQSGAHVSLTTLTRGWGLISVADGCTVVAEAAAVFHSLSLLLVPSGFPLGGDQKLTEVPT